MYFFKQIWVKNADGSCCCSWFWLIEERDVVHYMDTGRPHGSCMKVVILVPCTKIVWSYCERAFGGSAICLLRLSSFTLLNRLTVPHIEYLLIWSHNRVQFWLILLCFPLCECVYVLCVPDASNALLISKQRWSLKFLHFFKLMEQKPVRHTVAHGLAAFTVHNDPKGTSMTLLVVLPSSSN